ncbi:methyltransferase domain-containing protein [Hymenobacter siberiensis]|jgi:SAM-dependent methyltransferase|uniref:methyltransferase domain-containing protein n=1 Tax=Hymenobacter siberiensis TaxID=2848396 RepID=UPI001C1DF987|nr:methyltransferase domain-containing protein [Hymenobacter siberiensis]MBU6119490.1 methyltransferase domain-containing protein [Hymenobacter siberiensis]
MNPTPPPLPDKFFVRQDETPDAEFYHHPRFVTHIDDAAIAAVTQLYREYFAPDSTLLDLMSSWVSHLPADIAYRHVVGLGMNAAELRANPRLNAHVVQDLNAQPTLPFADQQFDGASICVSIDYLTQPVAVLRELARVLRPGAPLVITFSNRCFPSKAVAAWHALDDRGHLALVRQYLLAAGGWQAIELLDRSPQPPGHSDPLFAVVARTNAGLMP